MQSSLRLTSRAIEYLVKFDVLEQTDRRKIDRSWMTPALLRIIEEPARLSLSGTE